ncbi:flagellar hook-length control protein FliK [uncultured Brachyspira sp.]|uniref:flagellar hook-length control protein FliK n=1 Tax=uncultured Brachyspira sp. TaxID=221953 RepID=UPI0026297855|nr:flagellar hook-length control protein FliK [uncultured Brachyspira sp.]
MVNGLGNLLSFVDTNVSSNNSPYNLNNYSYDDSFANMLNKTQTDYSAPSSVSNKIERHLNTEENQTENNYNSYDDYYNDYNQYDAEENTIEEKVSSSSKNAAKKTDGTSDNAEEAKSVNNAEEQAENKSEELNASSNKDNIEEKAEKLASGNKEENVSAKEKLALTKEKAKLLLQNTSNDKKADAKEVNTSDNKENILAKADKKENTKNTEEIEKIKKQIESLNAEELSEEDKKELEDLIESLEALKAMIENDGSEDKKEVLAENTEENIEVKDIDNSEAKEIKVASNKDNDKNIETKDINNISIEDNAMADANIDMNIENKYADKKDAAEMKNNNSTVNNTISDDKGAELTIINMKDSAEGANLKGYNHYNNNVSKTHNSTNLTDNMIKFQDLMGKLVEKAQVAVNNGKSEVLMSLNPEYLGKVRLKISMDGDNLIGKIFVDNADVKDIFTKNLDTVITSLSEIGINIEGFDVMLRQDMPNDGGFGEELEAIGNRFASENSNNVEEVKADIKAYIVPERKLNLLI